MPRRRDPISQLETAIECLPRTTREAMLEGIRTRPIIAGAYTDNRGGICPMLAAHRGGARTSLLSFARSWDAFARAKRVRRATRRELRVLEDLLVASLESETDLGAAIAAHQASAASRPEVVDEPQQPQQGEGLGEEVIRAGRGFARTPRPAPTHRRRAPRACSKSLPRRSLRSVRAVRDRRPARAPAGGGRFRVRGRGRGAGRAAAAGEPGADRRERGARARARFRARPAAGGRDGGAGSPRGARV